MYCFIDITRLTIVYRSFFKDRIYILKKVKYLQHYMHPLLHNANIITNEWQFRITFKSVPPLIINVTLWLSTIL